MGADVRDFVAGQYGKTGGMDAMAQYLDTMRRALAEYVLETDPAPAAGTAVALRVENGRLLAAVGSGAPFELLALLPQAYRGDIEAVEAELDAIVGLEPVKSYLRELAGNVQASSAARPRACRWPKSTAT